MMQATCLAKLGKTLERELLRELDARLWNWGRWWHRDHVSEQDRDTGRRHVSIAYVAMTIAPKVERTGYYNEHPEPIDAEDAELLHREIAALRAHQVAELKRYYANLGGSGTEAQKNMRWRARRKLAFISNF